MHPIKFGVASRDQHRGVGEPDVFGNYASIEKVQRLTLTVTINGRCAYTEMDDDADPATVARGLRSLASLLDQIEP